MENNESNIPEKDFTNIPVNIVDLPKMEEVRYTPLHSASLYVNMVVLGIIFLLVVAGVCVLGFTVQEVRPYLILSLLVVSSIFVLFAWIEYQSFRFRGYALRTHDLLYREGWLWKSWIVIPFNRIQHLEINQGPIDRLFDLAALQLYTAGGASSDIEIDGLTPQTAADIKSFITGKNTSLNSYESDPAL